jgi:predicted regulator of Ras-like GTPase activity (Roadblock/LC7/MglB family)
MKRILQAVHAVDGVQGTLVLEGNGQLLAYQAHALYDLELLEKVSQTIVSTVDSVQLLREDWETLSVNYYDGTLIIRIIKPGGAATGRTVVLALIADNRLNPSFAGVAMRVAATKLKNLLESPNSAADLASSSTNLSGSNPNTGGSHASHSGVHPNLGGSQPMGVAMPSAGGNTPPPVPQGNVSAIRTDMASSGLSWSGLGSSGRSSATDVAVADAESSAFLTVATKTLGASVGPMAKVFVKEAVRRLCPDRTFSRTHWEALIAELRKHIGDNDEASEFQKKMRARL